MMQREPLQVKSAWTAHFSPKRVHHERIWHEVFEVAGLRAPCSYCGSDPGRYCTVRFCKSAPHLAGFKVAYPHMSRNSIAWAVATEICEGPPWAENPPNIRKVTRFLGHKPRTIEAEAAEKAAADASTGAWSSYRSR